MTTWTERMHRRAATLGTVVTSCAHSQPYPPYPHRLDKVKFGVPLDEVCRQNIPGPLLVLILKLNKEAPYKRDVFRAPGHQGNVKKLIQFLQTGRLVNLDNFSVYTIASVLKKFLRKIPDGIFGAENEETLFKIIEKEDDDKKREEMQRLLQTLPDSTQQVLVLLVGTFRMMALQADRCHSGMTSEALGVSVAPSFFQSCVSDGKHARMQDVNRFKVATRVMQFMIDQFGVSNLFGRENYEFYARITGRILKVEQDWIFSFRYPIDPVLTHHQSCLQDASTRLSVSLGENGLCQSKSGRSGSASSRGSIGSSSVRQLALEELKDRNKYAESTKSLSYLPQVHERQTARMKTRSEWFLSPIYSQLRPYPLQCLASVNEGETPGPTKPTVLVRRSSSKRGKENTNKTPEETAPKKRPSSHKSRNK